MDHLHLTWGGSPVEGVRGSPIDDPDAPMTEASLRELELDRAADEGMIGLPGPETGVPGQEAEVPRPEDDPRRPGVDVPGTEVPGPEDEPTDPEVEAPGRDDRPPIVSADLPRRSTGLDAADPSDAAIAASDQLMGTTGGPPSTVRDGPEI